MGEQAKPLLPFLQRADEMARADPKVAYYCRLYAVEEGMRVPNKSPELNEMLGLLLRQLEETKPSAGLLGAEDDEAHVENFALKIFAKADRCATHDDAPGPNDPRRPQRGHVRSNALLTRRLPRRAQTLTPPLCPPQPPALHLHRALRWHRRLQWRW